MVFAPTPPVNKPGATMFSFAAIRSLGASGRGRARDVPPGGRDCLDQPTHHRHGRHRLGLAGTVAPSGTAVQVGLSTSATVAPTSWTAATVTGGTWSASLTPSAAGTYYIWAEQTGSTSVQAVSAAVTVTASTAAPTITNTYGSTYSWGINPSYAPAATYSSATNGARRRRAAGHLDPPTIHALARRRHQRRHRASVLDHHRAHHHPHQRRKRRDLWQQRQRRQPDRKRRRSLRLRLRPERGRNLLPVRLAEIIERRDAGRYRVLADQITYYVKADEGIGRCPAPPVSGAFRPRRVRAEPALISSFILTRNSSCRLFKVARSTPRR